MFNKKHTEVLVVGAGPVGLMTALLLKRKGVDVIVIDHAERITTCTNSTLLHPSSLVLMEKLGFLDSVLETATKIQDVEFYDGAQIKSSLDYTKLGTEIPYFVSLSQATLESILEQELKREGVKVLWNHKAIEFETSPNGVNVTVQRLSEQSVGYAISRMERMVDKIITIDAKTAIAADGYNSIIKRQLYSQTINAGLPENFILFDFKTDGIQKSKMRVSLTDNLIAAQFPISEKVSRIIFQFEGMDLPDDYRMKSREIMQEEYEPVDLLSETHLRELISDYIPWDPGYIDRIMWRVAVPFQQSFTERETLDNIILLGDATRTFGPVSSASINLGFLETDKITRMLARGENDMSELKDLCDSFPLDWQIRYNSIPYSKTDDTTESWISLNRNRIIPSIPAIGRDLAQLAEQLSIRIERPTPSKVPSESIN